MMWFNKHTHTIYIFSEYEQKNHIFLTLFIGQCFSLTDLCFFFYFASLYLCTFFLYLSIHFGHCFIVLPTNFVSTFTFKRLKSNIWYYICFCAICFHGKLININFFWSRDSFVIHIADVSFIFLVEWMDYICDEYNHRHHHYHHHQHFRIIIIIFF